LFEQAQAAEEAGDLAQAERLYRVLMKSDPSDAASPFNLGNLLRANGRKAGAEAALRAATRADPTFAEAWYNLSDLLDEEVPVKSRNRLSAPCVAGRPGICRRDVQSCASAQRSGGVLETLSRK
jgi:predicted Zn-dependent protease